jgi:basic membrane lipoprotein Med (substrate-binding protein (PBP1-ABC) superfamily)
MPRITIATVTSLAVVAVLLSGAVVVAQDEEVPLATLPPAEIPGVTMTIVRNELTEPAINETVERAGTFAFTEVGGKRNGLTSELRSGANGVVRAAFDAAERGDLVVLISGGDSQATVSVARDAPETSFLDIDQPLPCVTADGRADPTSTCEGGAESIPSNYMAVDFDTDEAAYLAGVVAASASREDTLGVISSTADCEDCNRTLAGFLEGARSVKPDIEVRLAYLSDGDAEAVVRDAAAARTFTSAFIDVYEPDVVLALVGSASRGVVEAACEAGVLAIGSDIDVSNAYPDLAACVLASITKDIEYAVREAVFARANEGDLRPEWRLGLADGHVGVTEEWRRVPGLPVDLADRYAATEQEVITGQVETCPDDCGAPIDASRLTTGSPAEEDAG